MFVFAGKLTCELNLEKHIDKIIDKILPILNCNLIEKNINLKHITGSLHPIKLTELKQLFFERGKKHGTQMF